jgi:hypothetical protein
MLVAHAVLAAMSPRVVWLVVIWMVIGQVSVAVIVVVGRLVAVSVTRPTTGTGLSTVAVFAGLGWLVNDLGANGPGRRGTWRAIS